MSPRLRCGYATFVIRNRRDDGFLLITQHDHALLSGKLAMHVGNTEFAAPTPYQPVVDGISMHDAGWPLHDDRPTLNKDGSPLNVLETPAAIATRVWSESAGRAAAHHPYCGLLVSLHVMGLSAIGQAQASPLAADPKQAFEINKFQHKQVELQETLRKDLGLRTDRALRLGLAPPGTDEDEDLLRFNFSLLRALDRVSLDICSGAHLFTVLDEVHARPGAAPGSLRVDHLEPGVMKIAPVAVRPPGIALRTALPPAQRYEIRRRGCVS